MSAGCVNKAQREWGENGPLKWVGLSQAGRLEMSSPLIPPGTETENKWSLTRLFSQGPASDLPLRRNHRLECWCPPPSRWTVQWSVSLVQWKVPPNSPPSSSPHIQSQTRTTTQPVHWHCRHLKQLPIWSRDNDLPGIYGDGVVTNVHKKIYEWIIRSTIKICA